jgi:hypothetical protein
VPGGTDVAVADGGTGASTLTGVLKGNGTSAITGSATLTDLGAPTAALNMNSKKINSLTDPTNPQEAATKAYVDSGTGTFTNKRLTPRIGTTASSGTPTINTDNVDQFNITALAAAITSMTTNLSGTPTDGQKLLIRIKDNGTARAIAWGASFTSSGVATLLATTVISKTHMVGLIWDAAASLWVCLAVDAVGY